MPSRKRLFSMLSSALVILVTAMIALASTIGNENTYSLNLPSDKQSEGTDSMSFLIGGQTADYYQLAFGSKQVSPDYLWVESLDANKFTIKNVPAASDTYVRVFTYNGAKVDMEDFRINLQGGNPQIESFGYTKNQISLDIIQTGSINDTGTNDGADTRSSFSFSPANGSPMIINTFTVTFPKTDIAYYGVGTTLAGADIAYGENMTTDHITFSTENLKVGDIIYIKIADQNNDEYYAQYTVADEVMITESGPLHGSADTFTFFPESGSAIPQGIDVTINFPLTDISYYAVGEGGASAYNENITTDHITFNTSLYQTGDTIEVKVVDTGNNEYYASYTIGESVDPYAGYDPGYKLSFQNGQRLINGCPIFTPDSYWNQPIDHLPVDELSAKIVNRMNIYNTGLRADFGYKWEGPSGIPFNIIPADQPEIKVTNITYADSSDIPICSGETKKEAEGCYPIPTDLPRYPLLENVDPDTPLTNITPENYSGDLHVLALQEDTCKLYEFFQYFPVLENGEHNGLFTAKGPTIWDLNKNADKFVGQKDENMTCNRTSADAAGLPIFPGLVLYDEVKSGEINHALRITTLKTRQAFVYPATHYASWISKDTYPADGSVEGISYEEFPPMGARLRLKQDFDISGYHPDVQVILRALKKYGAIVADNGGPGFISGAPDKRWENKDEVLNQLKEIPTTALELVEMGTIYDPETTNALGNNMASYNCAGIESNHVDKETFRLPDYAQ